MFRGEDLSLVWNAGGHQRVRREVASYLLQVKRTKIHGPHSANATKLDHLLLKKLGPDWRLKYSTPGKQGKLRALLQADPHQCFHFKHLGSGMYVIRLILPRLQAAVKQASAQHQHQQQQQHQQHQQHQQQKKQKKQQEQKQQEQNQQQEQQEPQDTSTWLDQQAAIRRKLNNAVAVAAGGLPDMPAPPSSDAAVAGGSGGRLEYWTRKRQRQQAQQQLQQEVAEYGQQQQQQQLGAGQQAADHHHTGGAASAPCFRSSGWYSRLLQVTPSACSIKPAVLIDLTEPPATWERPLRRCLDHLGCCHLVGLGFELAAVPSLAVGGDAEQPGAPAEQADDWDWGEAQQEAGTGGMEEAAAGLQLCMLEVFAPAANAQGGGSGSTTATSRSRSRSGIFNDSIYLIALPEEPGLRQAVVQRLLKPLLTSPHLVKVTHAPQLAAAVLQQHHSIELKGVLDTQLLAGVVAAAGGSTAAQGGAAATGQQRSSTAAGSGPANTSLADLYQQYGLTHPAMQGALAACGTDGPDSIEHLLERAAGQVRYLLPLAAALLKQLPAAAGAQLSHATAQRLSQLKQQLQALCSMRPPAAGSQPQWAAGVGVPFDLVLDQQHQPSYQLYLGPEKQERPSNGAAATAAGAAAAGSGGAIVHAAAAGTPSLTMTVDEGVASLLDLLPPCLHLAVAAQPGLLEVVIDHGRPVQLVLPNRSVIKLPGQYTVSIQQALAALGAAAAAAGMGSGSGFDERAGRQLFGSSNRLSLVGSLHRVSAMYTTSGAISGLTYRVGRHMPGVGRLLLDVLAGLKSSLTAGGRTQSLLLLGRPGTGKTTLLRDISRLLSTSGAEGGLGLRVVVVDSSNEIAGDGPVPHPCIGDARRMMVPSRGDQASIMIEAVENHCPDVIIVDEIGTRQEAEAARTIAQRGVVLVGTAHGIELGGLLKNPDLVRLVGGVTPVTLGDAQAAASNQGRKVRLERAGAATFTSLVELQGKNRWRYHPSVEHSVDTLLSGHSSSGNGSTAGDAPQLSEPGWRSRAGLVTQLRSVAPGGQLLVEFESEAAAAAAGVCAW